MSQPASPHFFIGRIFDPTSGKLTGQEVLYDPANLTTHAVVTGMTGSGKTGLCIVMLEEAALKGIPALIIDLKGDLTNLVLHFPEQTAQTFEPWLDAEAARRAGKDLPTLAAESAARWEQGQADWGLDRSQRIALQNAAQFTIFTPGSTAGKPVNILSSFQPPNLPWEENRELLREKIASTVTALLGLIGLNEIDPLRSREHILLANIMEAAWSQNHPLDMTELILQIQSPPFARLGAFAVDSFFPRKERFELAVLLNNFLAAPSFQSWLEGQALDVPALLYQPDGRPRHSIFYLAHLDDNERMFFVTLLFAAVEAWMRTQRGTGGLRALLYFDEIMGYLPPVLNPPSKPILLRMLKQARAFGVGLLLATQNPVDLDYKALSNAGTWIIGRLQTEQDKQRLLDGLQNAGGSLDMAAYNRLISGLQKRVFLLHNVHGSGPQLFQSRWALNFLAGPLTRSQIPELNRLAEAALPPVTPAGSEPPTQPQKALPAVKPLEAAALTALNGFSATRPVTPAHLDEYFLAADLDLSQSAGAMNLDHQAPITPQGLLYRPALLAQAQVRYLNARYRLDYTRSEAALLTELEGGLLRWEEHAWRVYAPGDLQSQPLPQSRFAPLPGWFSDSKRLAVLQKSFIEAIYRSGAIELKTNPSLKIITNPITTHADFREVCSQAARAGLQAQAAKINASYNAKITALRLKIEKFEAEEQQQREEVDQRKLEELSSGGELLLSIFSKRKRSATQSLAKRRLSQQARSDLEQYQQQLASFREQLEALTHTRDEALQQAQEQWAEKVNDLVEVPINPQKKDIYLELFGIAWMPFYVARMGEKLLELPAYRAEDF